MSLQLQTAIDEREYALASLPTLLLSFYRSLRLPTLAQNIQLIIDAFIRLQLPVRGLKAPIDRLKELLRAGSRVILESGISDGDLAELLVRYRPRMEGEKGESARLEDVRQDVENAVRLEWINASQAGFLGGLMKRVERDGWIEGVVVC